jgi:hypothetical protein
MSMSIHKPGFCVLHRCYYSKHIPWSGIIKDVTIFKLEKLPSLLIRLGLAFVFIYAAMAMELAPKDFIHYVPEFVRQIIPVEPFLHVYGVYEIVLALWLLSNKWVSYSSILSTVTLMGITVLNIDVLNVVFRNIGIIFASLALFVMSLIEKQSVHAPTPTSTLILTSAPTTITPIPSNPVNPTPPNTSVPANNPTTPTI